MSLLHYNHDGGVKHIGIADPQIPDESGHIGPIDRQNVNITIVVAAGTKPASTTGVQQQAISLRGGMMEPVDLGFTELEIYGNYVICRTAAGETLTRAKHEQILTAVRAHVEHRFYLVLDEVYPHAIDLDALFALRDDRAIIAICIVAYRDSTRLVLKSARDIVEKPVFFFDSVEAATLFVAHRSGED